MPIRLDLLRHGHARPADDGDDAARLLTPRGAAAVRALGVRLREQAWRPERVLASPLARARETAAIVTTAADAVTAIEITPELEPERHPEHSAVALAAEIEGTAHALLVGHQPLLGALVEYWTGVPSTLSPGELVTIEFMRLPRARSGRIVERLTAG